jgi:hypothetical protein
VVHVNTTPSIIQYTVYITNIFSVPLNFVFRLQKENKKNMTLDETHVTTDTLAINDIKSAVPGTPVPNRRNWVIGKFGRALPIVFLRRKDGRKIAKFDPSKTVHCLKKLREDRDRQDDCVDSLTWSLDDPDQILNDVQKKGSLNPLYLKRSRQEIEEDNSYEVKAKIRTKKNDSSLGSIQRQNNKTVFNSDDCISKSNDESISLSSINRSFNNDETSTSSSNDESVSKDLPVMSYEEDSDSGESSTLSDSSSNSRRRTFESAFINGQNQRDKQTAKPCCDASSSEESTELKESEKKNEEKYSEVSSSDKSSSSSDETEESDQVSETKNSNSVVNSSVNVLRNDETNTNYKQSSCTSKLSEAESCQSRNKKELSNKLRLETLEERKEILNDQKEIVKKALQNVDTGLVKGGNHVVFENGDDCMEENTSLSTDTKVGLT